jgi:hypothetical protein
MIGGEQHEMIGLPRYLDRAEADSLAETLQRIWTATVGMPPADLDDDLKACKRWFDPVAQGQRLRRELAALPILSVGLADPGEPMTLRVAAGKLLVTPEGRCALDLLRQLPRDRSGLFIADTQVDVYYRKLALLYREWSLHRLRTVVDLLAGETKPLQISAAGVVIALLVNRSTSEDRALTRFASGRERDLIDQAFFAPVEAFSDVLAPKRRKSRGDPRLISGWMLYEARRRLDGGIIIVDAKGSANGKVWIREEDEGEVIRVVSRDLARGHRLRATPERFGIAFDALVRSLRKSLPRLASFELVHERPKNTDQLRHRLLASLRESLESSV